MKKKNSIHFWKEKEKKNSQKNNNYNFGEKNDHSLHCSMRLLLRVFKH